VGHCAGQGFRGNTSAETNMPTFRDISSVLLGALALPACSVDAGGMQVADEPNTDEQADRDAGSDEVVDAGQRDASSASDARRGVAPRDTGPAGDDDDGAGECDRGLEIVVRDFTEEHPDFEHYTAMMKGIVKGELGSDMKPVYASSGATVCTSGPDAFAQWYNDVDGVNQRLAYTLQFSEERPGVFVYDSSAFFPIDGMGFGNGPSSGGISIPGLGAIGGGAEHNFLFTTEAHLKFSYTGGEQFTFRGDDDLWVFINGKLALDLGGTHSALMETVDLDAQAGELGLDKGESYPMDIFHAERHTSQSNYRIETTIDLSCVENVPVI
jgi:fibro-slime domain-containing protein